MAIPTMHALHAQAQTQQHNQQGAQVHASLLTSHQQQLVVHAPPPVPHQTLNAQQAQPLKGLAQSHQIVNASGVPRDAGVGGSGKARKGPRARAQGDKAQVATAQAVSAAAPVIVTPTPTTPAAVAAAAAVSVPVRSSNKPDSLFQPAHKAISELRNRESAITAQSANTPVAAAAVAPAVAAPDLVMTPEQQNRLTEQVRQMFGGSDQITLTKDNVMALMQLMLNSQVMSASTLLQGGSAPQAVPPQQQANLTQTYLQSLWSPAPAPAPTQQQHQQQQQQQQQQNVATEVQPKIKQNAHVSATTIQPQQNTLSAQSSVMDIYNLLAQQYQQTQGHVKAVPQQAPPPPPPPPPQHSSATPHSSNNNNNVMTGHKKGLDANAPVVNAFQAYAPGAANIVSAQAAQPLTTQGLHLYANIAALAQLNTAAVAAAAATVSAGGTDSLAAQLQASQPFASGIKLHARPFAIINTAGTSDSLFNTPQKSPNERKRQKGDKSSSAAAKRERSNNPGGAPSKRGGGGASGNAATPRAAVQSAASAGAGVDAPSKKICATLYDIKDSPQVVTAGVAPVLPPPATAVALVVPNSDILNEAPNRQLNFG